MSKTIRKFNKKKPSGEDILEIKRNKRPKEEGKFDPSRKNKKYYIKNGENNDEYC